MALKNAFIIAFLSIQLIVPLRGFIWDRFDTRGDFSWNMYADDYFCLTSYRLISSGGEERRIDFWRFFNTPARSPRVLNRAVLSQFHAWWCRELRRTTSDPLLGRVGCQLNGGPMIALITPAVDICSAPNFGVIRS